MANIYKYRPRQIRTRLTKWGFKHNDRRKKFNGSTEGLIGEPDDLDDHDDDGDAGESAGESAGDGDGDGDGDIVAYDRSTSAATETLYEEWDRGLGLKKISRESSPRTFVHDSTQSLYDQAIYNVKRYCFGYATSAASKEDLEPRTHRETHHAIFAQVVQDSIALRNLQNEKWTAKLNEAFEALEFSVTNPRPMNLALIMSVLCNVERQGAQDMQAALLEHSREAVKVLPSSHPWIPIFEALNQSSEAVTDMTLRCMTIACDTLTLHFDRPNWQTLYVMERFCDCLYYMGIDGTRIETRRALLEAQIQFYAPDARNVLYTMTNVADDLRQQGKLLESGKKYSETLLRAGAHRDYDGAKTRFPALEGLADTWMELAGSKSWSPGGWELICHTWDRSALGIASEYLSSAEAEALAWFDRWSHRVLRVQRKKHALHALIQLIDT